MRWAEGERGDSRAREPERVVRRIGGEGDGDGDGEGDGGERRVMVEG